MMEVKTIHEWDDNLWESVWPIYYKAFGPSAKPKKIIKNMFLKNICQLHVGYDHTKVIAMALTGMINERNTLIIDYLTVEESHRHEGIGAVFLKIIKNWAQEAFHLSCIIIEVESDPTPTNLKRIRFWEKCGFTLTEYIHHYKWVPEPYKGMILYLSPDLKTPKNGEEIFSLITHFHHLSYSKDT